MKTNLLRITILLCTAVVFFASCSRFDEDEDRPSTSSDAPITVPFFVANAEGTTPSDPNDLLFEVRQFNPITTPDGHQITWGEFASVTGRIDVHCQRGGVEVNLELEGLIPNGVYTMWNVVFDDPGMDPTDPMLGLDGLGAAGMGDGSDNGFVASATGTASIKFFSPAGELSMVSNTDLGECPLTDNFEWHVVGAYHIDNQTYGGYLGPDGTAVEQFGFIFRTN